MRKFIFAVVAIIVVGIVVVAIPKSKKEEPVSQEAEKEDTIDSAAVAASKEASERLAFWFPRHDSLNHGLVLVAEELWKLDSAAANSNTIGRFVSIGICKKPLLTFLTFAPIIVSNKRTSFLISSIFIILLLYLFFVITHIEKAKLQSKSQNLLQIIKIRQFYFSIFFSPNFITNQFKIEFPLPYLIVLFYEIVNKDFIAMITGICASVSKAICLCTIHPMFCSQLIRFGVNFAK